MDGADNNVFVAARPDPYTVLGLRLKPFTLGHYFLLKRHGSPFVSDEAEPATQADLVFGVLACSMTPDEFERWTEQPRLPFLARLGAFLQFCIRRISWVEFLVAWLRPRCEFEVVKWGKTVGAFDVAEKVKLFADYIADHSRMPKVWLEQEAAEESGSHWAHSVFVSLTGNLGLPPEKAMALPLSEALLHFFKFAETQGRVRFMTGDELEATHG